MTEWWNWYYIENQISPHFFYYPVRLMIEKGFDTEVLTVLHPERRELKYETRKNLSIYRLERKTMPMLCFHLLKQISRKNYSLIHMHDIYWLADSASWIASRIKNIPVVYTSHNHFQFSRLLEQTSQLPFMRERLIRRLLVESSEKHVFIAFTKAEAETYSRIGVKRIEVIPHGIDPEFFNVEHDKNVAEKYKLGDFNILCVGAYDHRKGQRFLVRSMPKILKQCHSAKLLLVGRVYSTPQMDYLEELRSDVSRLGLENCVRFISDLSRSELIQIYLASSMFALPSQAEMFGLVFLEAMAAGLPIMTVKKPHITELLGNGKAGILVDRDQESIEGAMLSLLENTRLRKNLQRNGFQLVQEKYRLDKVIQQLWNLYQRMMND